MSTPLVLLHGFLGSAADWEAVMDGLAPERASLALNLPGHGVEPDPVPEDASFDEVVEALHTFLAQIETPQIDLLGYSMGGRVALGLMVADPGRIRRAILVGASPGLDEQAEREARSAADRALADALEEGPFETWLKAWYGQPLFADLRAAPGFEDMLARRRTGRPEALAAALRVLSPGRQPPLRQPLATCPVRALLMSGARDAKYTALNRALAEANPRFESVTVPDAGHAPHLENPDAFLHAVRTFLEHD